MALSTFLVPMKIMPWNIFYFDHSSLVVMNLSADTRVAGSIRIPQGKHSYTVYKKLKKFISLYQQTFVAENSSHSDTEYLIGQNSALRYKKL